jgi:predicted CXXCH cytochrome family protein
MRTPPDTQPRTDAGRSFRSSDRNRLGALLAVLVSIVALAACGDPTPAPRPALREKPTLAPAPVIEGQVQAESLQGSVHEDVDCNECHAPRRGERDAAHGGGLNEPAQCASCHEPVTRTYAKSVHAKVEDEHQEPGVRCVHCHGAHDTRPKSDPRARTYRRQISLTCSQCHQPTSADEQGDEQAVRPMVETIHQRALVTQGLLAAPSCIDCHGSHEISSVADPKSPVNRSNVTATCGKCHQGIAKKYAQGVHGELLAAGNGDAPVCTDCHRPHGDSSALGPIEVDSESVCGRCHQRQLQRYLQTYHGKALHLGHGTVAACHDCHGRHGILRATDPDSMLSDQNRTATCARCHPGATDSFAAFQAHGDYTDSQNYPILFWTFITMTSLILGTFVVWGIHTLLWAVRMVLDLWRDPEGFREEKARVRTEQEGKLYSRFTPIDRFCHTLVIISFLTLVATGMPLKFPQNWFSQLVFDLVGGAEVAASLHRIAAIISFLYLGIHISRLVVSIFAVRGSFRDAQGHLRLRRILGVFFGPDSPLPNPSDVKDVADQTRWFLGRGKRPQFDRFTYWEKFDYIAEFWGSAFIGFSGLVMWFPETFTTVAPGWVVNVAHVIHSQEALLAAGFILTFHFFNGHLRTEKFPLDTVMFSGRITEEELMHERGRQYERLKESGQLEQMKSKRDWTSAKWIYGILGLTAVYLGLALAAMIGWSLVQRALGG